MSAPKRHDYFEPDTFGRAVQDQIGDDVLLRLRMTLGGREVRIPRGHNHMLDDHWLVRAIGREAAERLVALFDGECIYIPSPPKDRAFHAAMEEGLTNTQIAARFGVSERHVRRCLAGLGVRNPNRQQAARQSYSPAYLARHQGTTPLLAAE